MSVLENAADKIAALAKKLAEVMAEIGPIAKRGENEFHHYNYARESEIVEAVREKLAKRSVVMLPSVTWQEKTQETTVDAKTGEVKPGKNSYTKVALEVMFVDGDTGATITRTWYGEGQDTGDKGLYKAHTGAIKYCLLKTFLIPTDDDPEKPSEDEQEQARRAKTQQENRQIRAQREPATEAQRKRLADLAKEKGIGADGMTQMMKDRFQCDSSKKLTGQQADELVKELEGISR